MEELTAVGHEYDSLVREGQGLRRQRDEAAARFDKRAQHLAALDRATARLNEIRGRAEGLDEMEGVLAKVRALAAAEADLAAIPAPEAPPDPDSLAAALEPLSEEALATERDLAETSGRLAASRAALDRAREVAGRAEELTDEADCPLCGQALGEAFEQVQSHRRQELTDCETEVARLEASVQTLAGAVGRVRSALEARTREVQEARSAWSVYQRASERRSAAVATRDKARQALGRPIGRGEVESLTEDVNRAKAARQECDRLAGQLDSRAGVESDQAEETDRLASLESELINLRDKVKALGFKPEALEKARMASIEAARAADTAAADHLRLSTLSTAATAAVDGHRRRLEDADKQHAALGEMEEETRHLGRLADLLNVFRNTVVGSVGPTLSAQAADLFGELTDREYDRLEVDPDTYEIQIRDAGVAYGMDRYSGSETDLANLALRVAISEHVRFQSGGTVGLLVLDEVFGPLDDDRKERMLTALERLKGRFRQVLVVTHASEIKEQLPSAIEVVKLPGRRATARVVNP